MFSPAPDSGGAPGTVSGRELLVDENMPRALVPALRSAGYSAEDVRDIGLRGHPDADVWTYAQTRAAIIVTYDKGLGDIRLYPKPHAGIIVGDKIDRLTPPSQIRLILDALATLAGQTLADTLVIVAPGRMRIHR